MRGEDIIVKETKTAADDRYVYFSPEMESLLKEYHRECVWQADAYENRTLTEDVVRVNVTLLERLTVTGEGHLILMAGCKLDAPKGITVNESDSLYIQAGPRGRRAAPGPGL